MLIFRNLLLNHINRVAMSTFIEGKLVCSQDEVNLDLSLLGGQSFRWKQSTIDKDVKQWQGVAYDCFWVLEQTPTEITYKVFSKFSHEENYFKDTLSKYLRLNFDLRANCGKWKIAHKHFAGTSERLQAVRVLDQEPLETIISFICSQNNNIKRISTMVNWLCSNYGNKICSYDGQDHYTFPTLKSLYSKHNQLESTLRGAKFGYRSKFIAGSVLKIHEFGGMEWFKKLKGLPYKEARLELVSLPGIGFKVADCICLMALDHLESVPIDTHIYKIAQESYLPHLGTVKSVTPRIYEVVADHFREVYGEYAGWAQAVLFCSGLQMFQDSAADQHQPKKKKKG